jgi:anaerobic ribonucleoside-triphosphate reductase activating protein
VIPQTTAEGPGTRFAVWVQGCSIRCDGCFNPHLWATRGGAPITPAVLADRASRANVEGVTLLGGEPFEQAEGLAAFATLAQQAGLSVMTFSGLYRHELDAKAAQDKPTTDLLNSTDLLVDGPYLANYPDLIRPWVGSTNQRFHFLTERYEYLQDHLGALPDRLEVRVTTEGTVSVNGWATTDQIDDLLSSSGVRSPGRGHIC